ncbi:PEP-CTERM-box response regulator transcription factor [Psychrosphaera aestuarii]|uniref:PEP-CTERM-box response regulator transcription factor n=1 Tax=Psychrosphaera aestuarii TaxID=1266052 RepID=UPI001B3239B7|nr:PEP-CTERM-box response regulator transcription factor [Psychrosphaera aestuarii]
MDKLLIVEDDLGIQKQLKWGLSDYELIFAEDRQKAISQLRRHEPKVVTLDLGLPPDPANASEGLAILAEIMSLAPNTKVIVVTGNSDKANALKAIELGAYDFYQKPIDMETLSIIVGRAFHLAKLEAEHRSLQHGQNPFGGIIGNSPDIQKACRLAERIAKADITTLLLGESGTGKEVFARAIHDASPRNKGPFVAINCASIPDNLLESELFGYEKGAFTGAAKTTKGKVEFANGGTLFLDEIGDMPLNLQAKMLRFLQERVIERVGGRSEISVNVRVICATHRDLPDMSKREEFREDLYYRVGEVTIEIPPLRDRSGDVVVLAKHFLNIFNKEFSQNVRGFSEDAIQAMMNHNWSGNIRELQNKLKSAVIISDANLITAEDLGFYNVASSDNEVTELNLKAVRENAESQAIRTAFAQAKHNISRTAELLGVTRPTLYSLIDKYNLKDIKPD